MSRWRCLPRTPLHADRGCFSLFSSNSAAYSAPDATPNVKDKTAVARSAAVRARGGYKWCWLLVVLQAVVAAFCGRLVR